LFFKPFFLNFFVFFFVCIDSSSVVVYHFLHSCFYFSLSLF
jgi:hypothetical protein